MQLSEKGAKKRTKKNLFFKQPQQQKQDKCSELFCNQMNKYSHVSQLSKKYSFNVKSVLGCGFASTVYLGKKNDTNEMVCIKAIDLLTFGINSPYIGMIDNQIQCLNKLASDWIVKLYDVYTSQTFYYLIMQLCMGGDLYKMLKLAPSQLPIKFILNIIKQIIYGINLIHDNNIIHRDLKTENIFICQFPNQEHQQLKVKIGDLGFCISLHEISKIQLQGKLVENVGSPIYMSPEISSHKEYSFSSDIYALGIIWYELLHKKAPWQAKTEEQLLEKKLKQGIQVWRADIDQSTKDIISKCLSNDPKERPHCKQIIEWIASHEEVVKVGNGI